MSPFHGKYNNIYLVLRIVTHCPESYSEEMDAYLSLGSPSTRSMAAHDISWKYISGESVPPKGLGVLVNTFFRP